MSDAAEPFFAVKEQPQKTRLQEKGKNTFHGQSLADDAAGGLGEFRPVGAELKFHGDAGDDAEGKVDAENFCPETRGAVVVLIAGAQRHGFEDDDQKGQAHGQLREQIVERNREGEMQTVYIQCGSHAGTSVLGLRVSGLEKAGTSRERTARKDHRYLRIFPARGTF